MIPLGTEQQSRRFPIVTVTLIAVTVAVSCLIWATAPKDPDSGEANFDAVHYVAHSGPWWRTISYQFAHADGLHLLGNMLFLWVFGPAVEEKIGHIAMTIVYFLGGVAAALVHGLVDKHPVIGASGSIAAITGLFLVLYPLVQIRVLWMFGIISMMNIAARWFILICIAKDLLFSRGEVAWVAHLGGYGAGMLLGFVLLFTKLVSRDQFDLLALGTRLKRRSAIRSAAAATPRVMIEPANRRGPAARLFQARKAQEAATSQKTMELRASVMEALSNQNWPAVISMYRELRAMEDLTQALRTLPRERQLELGKGLLEASQFEAAAIAFDDFATTFPRDAEAFPARAMASMVRIRHCGGGASAIAALRALRGTAPDAEHEAMIDSLLAEAEAQPPK